MQKKYTVSLIVVLCAIILCISILIEYRSFLKKEEEISTITFVTEELSIHYPGGKDISITNEEQSVTFSVTNHSNEHKFYYIKLVDIEGNDDTAYYNIQANTDAFRPFESDFKKTDVAVSVEILPNETHRYKMNVTNKELKEFSFDIEIDLAKMGDSFANTIISLENVQKEEYPEWKENGLNKSQEEKGDIYYFRGNITTNHVSFANLPWRIVSIQEDGSVKLILDQTTESMIKVIDNENQNIASFKNSNINQLLSEWYDIHLKDYDDFILSTSYCYDNSIIRDENDVTEYLSHSRIWEEENPTNACNGETISQKIALLSVDEAMYAGLNKNENKENYLYLDSLQAAWWTMTPSKREKNITSFFAIDQNGSIVDNKTESTSLFLRPTITLVKTTKVTGNGTEGNPYIVEKNN